VMIRVDNAPPENGSDEGWPKRRIATTVFIDVDGLTPEDWQAFERTKVQPSMNPIGRRQGAYAVAARKRRAEEKRR
jgi:hypothetical protein